MSDYTVLTDEQKQELLAHITAANAELIAIAAMLGAEKKTRKPRKARKVAAEPEAEAEPAAAPKRRGRPPKMVEPAAEDAAL
jgi:hypothetical protein